MRFYLVCILLIFAALGSACAKTTTSASVTAAQNDSELMLIGFMQKGTIGLHRLRGDLPSGTVVADKTGSGEPDEVTKVAKVTNDVGIITLPSGRGHLSIAVLVNQSKLPDAKQEKLIAELARAAYDAYAK